MMMGKKTGKAFQSEHHALLVSLAAAVVLHDAAKTDFQFFPAHAIAAGGGRIDALLFPAFPRPNQQILFPVVSALLS